MSSLIFPLSRMPLASRSLRRVASRAVPVQRAENGKGYPIRRRLSPGRRWAVDFGPMSEAAGEVQELARFAGIHGGRFDTFLLRDPLDYQVSDHGFGVGDGATTVFQLQRAPSGSVSDVLGTWPLSSKPRINRACHSKSPANWNLSTGVTATDNAAVAPDGTVTAGRIVYDGSGTAGQSRAGSPSSGISLSGQSYASGIWLRADAPLTLTISLNRVVGSATVVNITTAWQRFSFADTGDGTRGTTFNILAASAGSNAAFVVYMWEALIETGAVLGRPITSGATATTQTPAYWPAVADGFEPVTEPGADLALAVDDWEGARALYPHSRTNLIHHSEPLLANLDTQSNVTQGSLTDNGLSNGATVPATATDAWAYETAAYVAGVTYTFTAFVKMADGGALTVGTSTSTGDLGIVIRGALVTSAATVTSLGGGLHRVVSRVTVATSGSAGTGIVRYTTMSGRGFTVTGYQLEASTSGSYIKTTGAAASRTDYALGAGGQVTFAVAPRSGAQLAWGGSFYRRARFASDDLELERIASGLWRSGRIELEEESA